MNTEHTPGPWRVDYAQGIIAANGTAVAYVEADHSDTPSPDARLIAAAPDLLDALKVQHECGMPEKSLLYYEEWVEGWRWVHPDGREWEVVGDWCRPMPYHPIVAAAIAKAEGKA